jgi:hypothetical protein
MTQVREGGCQCGAVRYRISGEPLGLGVCHCTECQGQSGSAFGMSLVTRKDDFTLLEGELKSFTRSSDSGRPVVCWFCPECGTRMYNESKQSSDQGAINVKPGTLDDTSWLRPQLHVWTASKQPWLQLSDGLPSREGQIGPRGSR